MYQQKTAAVIYVNDIKRVSSFYAAVLDLKIKARQSEYFVLESEIFQLVVLEASGQYRENVPTGDRAAKREMTPIKLAFYVQEIETLRTIATQFSGKLYDRNKEWEFDSYIVCDGQDPEGNVFQLRAPVVQ